MRRRDAGITIVEILAAITIIIILISILVTIAIRAGRYQKIMECQGHLHTMFEAQAKAPPSKVQEYGRGYWVRLTQTTPPALTPDVLKCPFVEVEGAPFCQYFGPGGDIVKLEAKDPIGCDMELSHSENGKQGGNLLLKSGEVVTDHTSLWASTLQTGKCRP
jgi:hypothetical protein